jgi:uncharacterized repeat protein (TIGR03803 family)
MVPYSFPPLETHTPFDTNQTGAYPGTSLVMSGGTLYGATGDGGAHSWGTVFSVNTNGLGFVDLRDFNLSDGQYPNAVTLSGTKLYGTTDSGGTYQNGTIFMMNTNGTGFTNLYHFSSAPGYPYTNSDGASPVGSLLVAGGTLYGTTSDGGSNAEGVVFSIGTNGTGYTVLHQFSATNAAGINGDGARPYSGLVMWSNVLYGTAINGGAAGAGTVFSLGTDGSHFTVLHHFSSINNADATNSDGANPRGDLIMSGSVLYGTASAGGTNGYGTIFSILFPPPLYVAHAGTNAVVTWPTNVIGFNLESTTNLAAPVWTAVSGQYAVTNPVTGRQKFFRLMHP